MKVKVESEFIDKNTGVKYQPEQEITLTKARVEEVRDVEKKLGLKLISEMKKEEE